MPRKVKKDFSVDTNVFIRVNDVVIKKEPLEEEETSKTIKNVHDFKNFKYEKKPHVKIEYEKEPPVKQENGLWEPANWRQFLDNLRKMRSRNDAPVDTMGCHMSMDAKASPEVIRYQHLISLMLSSQTKDQVTFAAMERLLARGLTIDNVLKMSDEELGKLIYPVGFWKTKVKYIKKTTLTLNEQYNGDIPDSVEKLCKLTGVGPKMAHICMLVAWNKTTGIGVDTHVHRISNRIGWLKKPTSTPEETRKSLQTRLPFDLWSEVNHLMVGFGQTICLPIGPFCGECLNKDICPSKGLERKSPRKTPKKSPIKTENSDDEFESKIVVKAETLDKKVVPRLELSRDESKVNDIENDVKSEVIPIKNNAKAVKRKVSKKKAIPKPEETENVTPESSDVKVKSRRTTARNKGQPNLDDKK